jgi:hypothetical protein
MADVLSVPASMLHDANSCNLIAISSSAVFAPSFRRNIFRMCIGTSLLLGRGVAVAGEVHLYLTDVTNSK